MQKQLSYLPEINVKKNGNKKKKIKSNFFSTNLREKVLFFLKKLAMIQERLK